MDRINIVELKKTMEDSYIDYAMSVIAQRALPDVRDGLKPVQRRILYAMIELNNGPDKPHRKCARIVGDTMGKYHPHGDSSIYDALVKLAQDFSTRYPLVDGHGNFGSIDGDGAAAMRYTEARLSKISMEMLSDINKETVDFVPNFDETEKEPTILPSRYPNLLVNGTTGIAVGMATNIPPHNLGEIIDAVVKIIDNKVEHERETDIDELLPIVKGPDFPTGATIVGYEGIKQAYKTGRGKITVRSVCEIETLSNGKSRIIVSELPYMVNKARLIEKMADLVKDKRVDGITDIRDESNRQGIRICIDIRRDANANIILNQLYKHTQLQETFSTIMLALVDNEPKILNLTDVLNLYLKHQVDVITRRCQYELKKARNRAHILEGLKIALDNIDEVIKIIRNSENVSSAKDNLCKRFNLSEIQANAIVEMRIKTLTALEKNKVLEELNKLLERIEELEKILADDKLLLGIIKDEILEIKEKYSDDRRTGIEFDENEISIEDLINNNLVIITRTNMGYIKRMETDNFKNQSRGGKGIKGLSTIEDDYTVELLTSNNHDDVLFFTNKGRVYSKKVYEIPMSSRTARGIAIVNLLQLENDEVIKYIKPVSEYNENSYILSITKNGIFRKTALSEFKYMTKKGKKGISTHEGDELVDIKIIDGDQFVYIISKNGNCIKFNTEEVRPLSRTAYGIKGIKLRDRDEVIGLLTEEGGENLLIVSENGYGKHVSKERFKQQKRGGYGVKCYKINEKTGKLVSSLSTNGYEEILIMSYGGIVIRINASSINEYSRNATGVKLMRLNDDKVSSITKAIIEEDEIEE